MEHHEQQNQEKHTGHFKALALTVVLAGMLLFGNGLELFAQPAPTGTGSGDGAAPPGEENMVCQAEMKKFIDSEGANYRAWMEQHFQNKSSSTSLLTDAIARYTEYRDASYKQYATFFPHQGALQLTEGIEPGACRKMMENELADARHVIETKAKSTSAVKKTTAIITKYQEINGQLRVLNQTFVNMKSFITTFSDKLPCYVRKSCNKG